MKTLQSSPWPPFVTTITCVLSICRAAEDELMAVADEKDKLAPQLEEARWHNRQLEKDVEQMQEKGNVAEQVTATVAHVCLLQKTKTAL